MSEFESMNREQREFEQALRRLQPVDAQLSSAELMFRAGQDAAWKDVRRQLRLWQCSTLVTSVCALAAIGFGGYFGRADAPPGPLAETDGSLNQITNPPDVEQRLEDRISVAEGPDRNSLPAEKREQAEASDVHATSPIGQWWEKLVTVSVSDPESYLSLRNRVIEQGPSALPPSVGGSGPAESEPLISSPQRTRELLNAEVPSQI